MDHNPLTGLIQHVEFEIHVPDDFPEKYHPTLIKLANQCPVKKHMENPPTMASVVKVD